MNIHQKYLSTISKISNNIYLSGVNPLADTSIIKNLGIKYILCCVPEQNVKLIHNMILMSTPDIIILYLPYNDILEEHLWKRNDTQSNISISKYIQKMSDNDNIQNLLQKYDNKFMIEIGYNFIDMAVKSNSKILVHCMAGISRSVSMIVYYLMKKYNYTYDQSIQIVKSARPIANPNDSFKSQLKNYDMYRDKLIL